MIETANLLFGVNQLWTASNLPDLVPGGLIFESVYSGSTYPYASAKVELGETEWLTGIKFSQEYILTIETYSDDITNVGENVATLQSAIYNLFPFPFAFESLASNPWNNNSSTTRTIQIIPLPSKVTEDERRIEGKPVILTRNKWSIKLRQQRY